MNTANLQLEGVYAALAALTDALRSKGLLTANEIDDALRRAEEAGRGADSGRLSPANADAVAFPLRYLRMANQASMEGRQLPFGEIAKMVGATKPQGEATGGGSMRTRPPHSEPQGELTGAALDSDEALEMATLQEMERDA